MTLLRQDALSPTRFQNSARCPENHCAKLTFLPDQVGIWAQVDSCSLDAIVPKLQTIYQPRRFFVCLFPTHRVTTSLNFSGIMQDYNFERGVA